MISGVTRVYTTLEKGRFVVDLFISLLWSILVWLCVLVDYLLLLSYYVDSIEVDDKKASVVVSTYIAFFLIEGTDVNFKIVKVGQDVFIKL